MKLCPLSVSEGFGHLQTRVLRDGASGSPANEQSPDAKGFGV